MAKVFIDGEAGTTGLGIRERLTRLAGIELVSLPAALRKDEAARLDAMKAADLVILCLPDEAARQAAGMVQSLGATAPKLLDASSAHRTAPGWIYGFPELTAELPGDIGQAMLVSNPGCYPTGAIALLRPLIAKGFLSSGQDVTINAVSGYSGGGKAMIAAHEAAGGPAFELYDLGLRHKHVPEIMAHSGLERRPIFVPSVGHFPQGMLVSIPIHMERLQGRPRAADLIQLYGDAYGDTQRILVYPDAGIERLAPQDKNGSDIMELFVCADEENGHVVLVAQLDNLGKGASGAAVQNTLLMLGMAETTASRVEMANA